MRRRACASLAREHYLAYAVAKAAAHVMYIMRKVVDLHGGRQMVVKCWLAFVGGVFCASLAAAPIDDTLENDGTWRAQIEGDARTARQGRVVISNFGGTWKELGARRAGDPCRGTKPFPITVQRSNYREVEFTVWAASVAKGCPDFALTLRVVDERTLAGTTSDGGDVRLVREPVKRSSPR